MGKEQKSKYAILGALSLEPMSGYDIKALIQRSIGYFWKESYGQIYPTLKVMVEEGLALSHREEQEGKPDRHIYALTEKGWQELYTWLAEPPAELSPTRNELLLKLFFAQKVPTINSIKHIEQYKHIQMSILAQYAAVEAHLQSQESPDVPYWLMTLKHGQAICRALIAWCDETITTLHTLERKNR